MSGESCVTGLLICHSKMAFYLLSLCTGGNHQDATVAECLLARQMADLTVYKRENMQQSALNQAVSNVCKSPGQHVQVTWQHVCSVKCVAGCVFPQKCTWICRIGAAQSREMLMVV